MKTAQEIRETIEETKKELKGMVKPTTYYDETWDSQLAEMGAWINALEWVIEGEDDSKEEREAKEDKRLQLTVSFEPGQDSKEGDLRNIP